MALQGRKNVNSFCFGKGIKFGHLHCLWPIKIWTVRTSYAWFPSFLQKAILSLEDIDCAFPSREEDLEEDDDLPYDLRRMARKLAVTLSGLLNVLDGISSAMAEDRKIFFATVLNQSFQSVRSCINMTRPNRLSSRISLHYTSTKPCVTHPFVSPPKIHVQFFRKRCSSYRGFSPGVFKYYSRESLQHDGASRVLSSL